MLKNKSVLQIGLLFAMLSRPWIFSQGIIVDHRHTDVTQIPESAILQAKSLLHIAYGHTSHGSQLVDGMSGLREFMNGLGYPANLYAFNSGGSGGALDFYDTPYSGAEDLGNPDFSAWAAGTRNYLNAHHTINVVIWSWCGQVSWASASDMNTYLSLMNGLETEFPAVHFVYMTGHLDGTGEAGTLHQNNQRIRNYCIANDKSLFDFADIESYDPDGAVNYMQLFANDNCDYDSDGDGYQDRNWAIDWQNAHTEGTDWYDCGAAHSQALNANRKAYAAWWLWARLAGWSGPDTNTPVDEEPPSVPENLQANAESASMIALDWQAASDNSGVIRYRIYRDGLEIGTTAETEYTDTGLNAATQYQYQVSAVDAAYNESDLSQAVTVSTLNASQQIKTIRIGDAEGEIEDAFLFEQYADSNFGDEPYVDEMDHFIIRFHLPTDVMNKEIISASLALYVWNQTHYQPDQYMEIFTVNRDWNEDQVTWNRAENNSDWSVPGGDFSDAAAAQIMHQEGEEHWDHTYYPEADLTEIVQEWADGTRMNYGLLISNDCLTGIGLKASEYGIGNCPYLEITYSDKSTDSVHPIQDDGFILRPNFPNPFNPYTTIAYRINQPGHVLLTIFNAQGQRIKTLVDGVQGPGNYSAGWDGTDNNGFQLASGLYYYRIQFRDRFFTGKANLIK